MEKNSYLQIMRVKNVCQKITVSKIKNKFLSSMEHKQRFLCSCCSFPYSEGEWYPGAVQIQKLQKVALTTLVLVC